MPGNTEFSRDCPHDPFCGELHTQTGSVIGIVTIACPGGCQTPLPGRGPNAHLDGTVASGDTARRPSKSMEHARVQLWSVKKSKPCRHHLPVMK